MRCPYCHIDNDRVVDTRSTDDGYQVRRKRVCGNCNRRFVTLETLEELSVRVVKREQSREPFDREKIRRGIERACSKRPITTSQIETCVQKIEEEIYSCFDSEIPAEKIGEIVLGHLADLDAVASIRFASVYREFDDADDFLRAISEILITEGHSGSNGRSSSQR